MDIAGASRRDMNSSMVWMPATGRSRNSAIRAHELVVGAARAESILAGVDRILDPGGELREAREERLVTAAIVSDVVGERRKRLLDFDGTRCLRPRERARAGP